MTINIEIPDEAKSDIIRLAAKENIPVEQAIFLFIAIGVQMAEDHAGLLVQAKKCFLKPELTPLSNPKRKNI